MATYLISNAVSWIGLTRFQSGDALIVTPGGALVMPANDLSDLAVGGATLISLGGYVALQSLAVDADVTFGITATGQFVSNTQGAALALHSAHFDLAGQVTAAKGTAVQMLGDGASVNSAGQIAGQVGIDLGGTAARVDSFGLITGTAVGVWVTGTHNVLHNSGTITGPQAVNIAATGSFTLTNAGLIQGDILATGESSDALRNSGTIIGDVTLGAGDDSFEGGQLWGHLDMGTGNDRVDARGQAVSGIIFDVAGADTYLIDSPLTRIRDTGAGRDTVQAWCSYTLSTGLEVLALRGSAALTGVGNAQANTLYGNSGNNRLIGGAGADRLYGGEGDDILRGGFGNDILTGGAGDDVLRGDGGADHLTGGLGYDRFVFCSQTDLGTDPTKADTITDFAQGSDKIDLSFMDANGPTSEALAFLGTDAFTGQAGQARWYSSTDLTWVELDVTGDGKADAVLALSGSIALTSSDFIL